MHFLKNKVLINSINNYFKEASINYGLVKLAQINNVISENEEIMSKADELIINEPELASQFSAFIDQYIDVIDALKLNAENVAKETDADELLNIFVTRADRVINNPYLNMDESLGWGEDFSPNELVDLVLAAKEDIQKKIEIVYGEGTTLSDAAAAAIAKELNNSVVDKRDKSLDFSGDKVKARYDYNKSIAERLRIARLTGPGSPDWNQILKQREARKRLYYEYKSDPEKAKAMREKTLQGVNKHREYNVRLEILESKLSRTRDKEEIEKIQKDIEKVKNSKLKYEKTQAAGKEKRIALREGDSMTSKVMKFKDLRNAARNDAKKKVKKKIQLKFLAEEHTLFPQEIEDLARAIQSGSAALIDLATRKLEKARSKKADEDESMIKVEQSFIPYNNWTDKLLVADKQGWFSQDYNIDPIRDVLNDLVNEGEELLKIPYVGIGFPNKSTPLHINGMLNIIKDKLNG
jgi:hypothetical protein